MTESTELGTQLERRDSDVTVISVILTQMNEMKKDLKEAIEKHSQDETDRWLHHEKEHAEDTVLFHRFAAHLETEEAEDLVLRTRLAPVKSAAGFLRREWRTIMLGAAIVVQAILGYLDRARM